MNPFEIVDVSAWPVASEETLGSKEKDWLRKPGLPIAQEELWLWKALTRDAGDDWAEKVAEQLAGLLELPHARVELARRGAQRGVICRDFRRGRSSFAPGNELLWQADPTYPRAKVRGVAEHTVERVLARVRDLRFWPPVLFAELNAPGAFVGYLMFDAWIGNQDRHHENWGAVVWEPGPLVAGGPTGPLRTDLLPPLLAPSFDHAASLGQYETDRKRELRLTTRDARAQLGSWAVTARSHMYEASAAPRRLTTFEAFDAAARLEPEAAAAWLDRLEGVEWEQVEAIMAAVPEQLMNGLQRKFALRLLDFDNRELLSNHRP